MTTSPTPQLERALNGVEVPVFCNGEQVGSYRKFDERLTIALLHWSTPRGMPVLGRRAAEAECHAGRFEALVGEIEAGKDPEEGGEEAPTDPGPAPPARSPASTRRSCHPRPGPR